MLVTRTIAGAVQFDPTDPTSGLFEFDPVPAGRGEITVKIENAGYNSDGPVHDIAIWLQPPGPIVPGGPRIEVAAVAGGNAITFVAGCVTPVPRDESDQAWTLRVETLGKAGDATVSIYYLIAGVTQ
jgi:hypothetical protein